MNAGSRPWRLPLTASFFMLLVAGASSLPAQETLVQVRAFQVREDALNRDRSQTVLYRSGEDPRLSPIKAAIDGTVSDLKAAVAHVIPALREIESAEFLFSLTVYWEGRKETLGDFVIQPPAAFRFELDPVRDLGGAVNIGFRLYAKEVADWPVAGSREEASALRTLRASVHPDFFREQMEKIADSEISLGPEEAGLLFLPYHERTLVLFLLPASRPQPLTQVLPIYPEGLRAKGVGGRGRYRVSVDDKGRVKSVSVKASVNPFLDDAAAEAMRKWTFEPVMRGLGAVGVSFDWSIDFDPGRWPEAAAPTGPGPSELSSPEIRGLLAQAASYCDRLGAAALDFVCRESIRSLDCALDLPEAAAPSGGRVTQKKTDSGEMIRIVGRRAQLHRDPWLTETYKFTSDYQMVRKEGRIQERRMLLKSNAKGWVKGSAPPHETRYASLRPLFVPVDILARDRQESYTFRIAGRERVQGRMTYVIEAAAKPGSGARIMTSKIWFDASSSQVLRCETRGLPVEGYEFIFEEAAIIGVTPLGAMTVMYEVEKNGIRFPSRIDFLIEYPVSVWGVGRRTRIDTQVRYDSYRFFTVETQDEIIRLPH